MKRKRLKRLGKQAAKAIPCPVRYCICCTVRTRSLENIGFDACPDGCRMSEPEPEVWYCAAHDFTSRIKATE
jgi:hypothetical protein